MFIRLASLLLAFNATSSDTPAAIAQKLFDAMKAHDTAAANALFLPGATLTSLNAEGKPSVTTSKDFADHIGASKNQLVERMWNAKTLEHGSIAVVWADYDFHLDGKFTHCGIDTFTMLKTDGAWKISNVSYTRQTTGCTSPK